MIFDPLLSIVKSRVFRLPPRKVLVCIIEQGDSDSEVIICFGVGCTLSHCYKLLVMN